jgi:SAM-dependent methyltransferase
MAELWDDELRDYRQRYTLPDQWIWDRASWPRVQFDGYMKIVLDLLPGAPADVLDVGCGPGLGAKLMCDRGYRVTGVDFNERGVAFGRILVPEAQLSHGDARRLHTRTDLRARFDAVTIIEVLEHIPPDFHDVVFEGIRAALRDGGVVVVSVPSNRLTPSRWDYKHFERQEVLDLLSRHGFQVDASVNQCHVGVLHWPAIWKLVDNRYYDLRLLKRLLRAWFLKFQNVTRSERAAGRFVFRAVKQQ